MVVFRMSVITISQLWIYPIKSLPGISLQSAQLRARGLEYDRRWMLVDENNEFITQRQFPQMALINVELEQYGIKVGAEDMPALIIPWVNQDIETFDEVEVKVWNEQCQAIHINSSIDNWFSEALGIDCQLVYMPEKTERVVDPEFALNSDLTSFSDGFPNLLVGSASLDDLNERMDEALPIQRFRPNIVVSGCDAYAEDKWKQFKTNDIDFFGVKACSRCAITTVDHQQGKVVGKEPLKTLSEYRRKGNKVYFGQNVLHRLSQTSDNILRVGDTVEILEIGKSFLE